MAAPRCATRSSQGDGTGGRRVRRRARKFGLGGQRLMPFSLRSVGSRFEVAFGSAHVRWCVAPEVRYLGGNALPCLARSWDLHSCPFCCHGGMQDGDARDPRRRMLARDRLRARPCLPGQTGRHTQLRKRSLERDQARSNGRARHGGGWHHHNRRWVHPGGSPHGWSDRSGHRDAPTRRGSRYRNSRRVRRKRGLTPTFSSALQREKRPGPGRLCA